MTNKLIRALPLVALAGILAGCGQGSHSGSAMNNTPAPAKGTVLVTVNGTPITTNEVNAFIESRTEGRKINLNPTQRYMVARQLVQVTLAAQAAKKEGLADKPDVQSQIALQRNLILANQAIVHYMGSLKIPEKTIRQKYSEYAKTQSGEEYEARHILVKKEAEAKKIIQQLNGHKDATTLGKYFASLAKKYSTGPSAKQGGELGWFKPQQMVPTFSAALEKLKPGEYTKTPVKTQFGWHVILLQKERTATPPSYTSMKPQIANEIKASMMRGYLAKLQSQAKVHWNVPNPEAQQPPVAASAPGTSKAPGSATKK